MAREKGPYTVGFPVNFTSEGDTTRDAFRKHMDEIARIYGILTGIDADTLDANAVSDMLQKHIDSTNPHPSYKPSVSWADLTGKPGLNDLSGTLSASKVVGELTNATIASGKVTGLEAFVNSKIPASSGDGITDKNLSDNGFVKFSNGLMVQWGSSNPTETVETWSAFDVTFPQVFPHVCYNVMLTVLKSSVAAYLVRKQSVTGFRAATTKSAADSTLYYVAIGA